MPNLSNWKRSYLNATEPFRVAAEAGKYIRDLSSHIKKAPKGDGHPVLVIPGFASTDLITAPLRRSLKKAGYKVYGWENGINYGFNDDKAAAISEQLAKIYEENGGQKVSIVGWSLGGIYARELAREYPEMVRDATSLFSPFGIGKHEEATPPFLVNLIKHLSDSRYSLDTPGMTERLVTPPPGIPTTSIYSKADGIGGWKACLNPVAPMAENVEVEGSHVGGALNLEALDIILDRLAQKEGQWKPYQHKAEHAPTPDPAWKKSDAARQRFFPKRKP